MKLWKPVITLLRIIGIIAVAMLLMQAAQWFFGWHTYPTYGDIIKGAGVF